MSKFNLQEAINVEQALSNIKASMKKLKTDIARQENQVSSVSLNDTLWYTENQKVSYFTWGSFWHFYASESCFNCHSF